MNEDFSDALLTVIVYNVGTMTSPVTMKAFKNGIRVPLGKYLQPNNGFISHQTFYDAVKQSLKFEPSCDDLHEKIVDVLSAHLSSLVGDCCKGTDR